MAQFDNEVGKKTQKTQNNCLSYVMLHGLELVLILVCCSLSSRSVFQNVSAGAATPILPVNGTDTGVKTQAQTREAGIL